MLNHVELLGRLAQEPEIRYTQSGTAVASFDLAVLHNTWKYGRTLQLSDVLDTLSKADLDGKYKTLAIAACREVE